jgi:hypothetical protein
MENSTALEISNKQTEIQMASVTVVAVAVYLLMFFFINTLGNTLGLDLDWLRRFGGLIILGFTSVGLLGTWRRGHRYTYSLTPEGLVVEHVTGFMGGKIHKVYPYKHITSLEIRQTMFGSRFNYGSIYVNMDKLEDPEKLALRNLVDPQAALRLIQDYMKEYEIK